MIFTKQEYKNRLSPDILPGKKSCGIRKNIKLTEGTPDMTKVRNHAFIRNNKDYPKNIHPSGSEKNGI